MLWKDFPDHGRNTPLAQECSNQLTPLQLILKNVVPPACPQSAPVFARLAC